MHFDPKHITSEKNACNYSQLNKTVSNNCIFNLNDVIENKYKNNSNDFPELIYILLELQPTPVKNYILVVSECRIQYKYIN